MRLTGIIEKPILTEKSVNTQAEFNKYAFKVNRKASKGAVAEAVEKLFGVNVVDVTTMIMPGKRRRLKNKNLFKKTPSWKKAIVKIKDGQKIDMFTSLLGENK